MVLYWKYYTLLNYIYFFYINYDLIYIKYTCNSYIDYNKYCQVCSVFLSKSIKNKSIKR